MLTQEEWQALLDRVQEALKARPVPTQAEIMAAMQKQRRVEGEMVAWLSATSQAAEAYASRRSGSLCS